MQSHIRTRECSSTPSDRTIEAMRRQVIAMASEVFEIGLFKPDAVGNEAGHAPAGMGCGYALAVGRMAPSPEPGWAEYLYPSTRRTQSQPGR